MLIPYYAWQELHYWARTQMNNGQIHHDFNIMNVKDKRERSALVSWDDTEHADYRNIQKWVDLNCGFIISVFEIYQATGDQKQFDKLWPYVKKAAQRIIDQVEKYGSKKYPYTFDGSENSYDAGGNPDPYNANISAVAYKIMTILAARKKVSPKLSICTIMPTKPLSIHSITVISRTAYLQPENIVNRYLRDNGYPNI